MFEFQNSGASGSATSVDLGDLKDLPFDMPKLRRRMRVGGVNLTLPTNISHNSTAANTAPSINNNHLSTDTSGVSQASSSQSVQQDDRTVIGEKFYCVYLRC